jgi:hypothetical protein
MLGVRIEVIVRSGYYTGVNFDWNLYWIDENKNDYVMDKKEIKRVFGMGYKSLLKDIEKWSGKVLQKEINELERHFSLVCDDELELIAVFSNGEGVYRSVRE